MCSGRVLGQGLRGWEEGLLCRTCSSLQVSALLTTTPTQPHLPTPVGMQHKGSADCRGPDPGAPPHKADLANLTSASGCRSRGHGDMGTMVRLSPSLVVPTFQEYRGLKSQICRFPRSKTQRGPRVAPSDREAALTDVF